MTNLTKAPSSESFTFETQQIDTSKPSYIHKAISALIFTKNITLKSINYKNITKYFANIKPVYLQTKDKKILNAYLAMPASVNEYTKFVILLHGRKTNRYHFLKNLFPINNLVNLNYIVLVPEVRTTYELNKNTIFDVERCVEYLKSEFNAKKIGLIGHCLGASIILEFMKYMEDKIDIVDLDKLNINENLIEERKEEMKHDFETKQNEIRADEKINDTENEMQTGKKINDTENEMQTDEKINDTENEMQTGEKINDTENEIQTDEKINETENEETIKMSTDNTNKETIDKANEIAKNTSKEFVKNVKTKGSFKMPNISFDTSLILNQNSAKKEDIDKVILISPYLSEVDLIKEIKSYKIINKIKNIDLNFYCRNYNHDNLENILSVKREKIIIFHGTKDALNSFEGGLKLANQRGCRIYRSEIDDYFTILKNDEVMRKIDDFICENS